MPLVHIQGAGQWCASALQAAISQTGVSAGERAVALAVFVLIGMPGPGAPVAIHFALGRRSNRLLGDLRV